MRAQTPLGYQISDSGSVPEVLDFIVDQTGMSAHEAYSAFNMGAGYALFVSNSDADELLTIADRLGHQAWVAGEVIEAPESFVSIGPVNVTYTASSLRVR